MRSPHLRTSYTLQAYDCTEFIELRAKLGGENPSSIPVETLASQSGVTLPLGYSQVLFATSSSLRSESARKALQVFLDVSAEGWEAAKKDPSAAVTAVMESRHAMGYPEEIKGVIDENSAEFQMLSLARCLPYVQSNHGTQSHLIDPSQWQKASSAMADLGFISKTVPASQSLDITVWPQQTVPSKPAVSTTPCEITDGLSLARKIRSNVAKRSAAFLARAGRSVSLLLSLDHQFLISANPITFSIEADSSSNHNYPISFPVHSPLLLLLASDLRQLVTSSAWHASPPLKTGTVPLVL